MRRTAAHAAETAVSQLPCQQAQSCRHLDPLSRAPFEDQTIPDHILTRMVEQLYEDDLDVEDVAAAYDYPLPLVLRELTDYAPRYRRWLENRKRRVA